MGQEINLKSKFQDYLHDVESFSLRSERLANDINTANLDVVIRWLEAAFIRDARVMAQDSADTLRDYAIAVAGIDEVCYTSEQAFDNAAENLMVYYTSVLREAEDE
jgi:hypothetical protein